MGLLAAGRGNDEILKALPYLEADDIREALAGTGSGATAVYVPSWLSVTPAPRALSGIGIAAPRPPTELLPLSVLVNSRVFHATCRNSRLAPVVVCVHAGSVFRS
jgi:hypothetical protein